jgi:hypothetical protein
MAQRRHPARPGRRVAGHSVAILLKIYAKCLDGQDAIAERRIEEALGDPGEDGDAEPPAMTQARAENLGTYWAQTAVGDRQRP